MQRKTLTLPGGKWVRRLLPGQTWMHASPGDWVGFLTTIPRAPFHTEEQLHIWKYPGGRWAAASSGFGYRVLGFGRTMGAAVDDLQHTIQQKIEEDQNGHA